LQRPLFRHPLANASNMPNAFNLPLHDNISSSSVVGPDSEEDSVIDAGISSMTCHAPACPNSATFWCRVCQTDFCRLHAEQHSCNSLRPPHATHDDEIGPG
jgi:hypothetical protein